MKPEISVLMTVFNEEKNVLNAVQSILNQSFSDFEFIIVNDGSTDKTKQKLGLIKDKLNMLYMLVQLIQVKHMRLLID